MNTISHIAAMVALLWASLDYAMGVLNEQALGFALLALFMLFIPLTIQAIADDVGGIVDRARGRNRGD